MGRKKSRRSTIPAPATPVPPRRVNWFPWKQVAICFALGVLTLVTYSNSFHAGFVKDSRFIILADPRVQQPTVENAGLIFQHSYWWPQVESGLYRPATTLSYLFNYSILGEADHPEGYHWINFFLHFANVLLVYALALRLLRQLWPAVFIAGLWAVHPVLTESVTNIIGRADLLAAFAILSGLLMYLKSTETQGWRRYAWLVGLAATTTLGVFSKESAVAILGVVVLYDLAFWKERRQLRGLLSGYAAICLPLVLMLIQRTRVLAASAPAHIGLIENPLVGAHFVKARLTAIAVIAKYLSLLIWPAKLSADYSYSQIPVVTGALRDWIAWIVVAAVVIAVGSQLFRNRLWFFFGAFAFVTFVPVSNLLFLTGTIMAERFLYLPAIGFAACAVMAVYALCKVPRMRVVAPIILSIVIVSFVVRTWVRNLDWQNELSIATASTVAAPNSSKNHFSRAVALTASDPTHANLSQSIDEMEKSISILNTLPDSLNTAIVYTTAGSAYALEGDQLLRTGADGRQIIPPASIQAYKRSLEVLDRAVAIDKANGALRREQQPFDAQVAENSADSAKLYEQLAITHMRLAEFQEAYSDARTARELDPSEAENYLIIGEALTQEGRKDEAAVAAVEGTLVSPSRDFQNLLEGLYHSGVDPEGCAMKRFPNGELLNPECPVVHSEICHASADLIGLNRRDQRSEIADEIESKAVEQFACSKGELESEARKPI